MWASVLPVEILSIILNHKDLNGWGGILRLVCKRWNLIVKSQKIYKPNVYLTLTLPAVILYESFLSYLGLGIQPPRASLGSLIAEGAAQINPIRVYWWMIVYPAGSLAALLMALNFLGDGLRDALDPRTSKD